MAGSRKEILTGVPAGRLFAEEGAAQLASLEATPARDAGAVAGDPDVSDGRLEVEAGMGTVRLSAET